MTLEYNIDNAYNKARVEVERNMGAELVGKSNAKTALKVLVMGEIQAMKTYERMCKVNN